jgi:hypothetical protein
MKFLSIQSIAGSVSPFIEWLSGSQLYCYPKLIRLMEVILAYIALKAALWHTFA